MPRRTHDDDPEHSRRGFLGAAAGAFASLTVPAASVGAALKPFALEEATVAQLGARMPSGDLSAQTLAAAYLERIHDVDHSGPRLSAVIELNPDAMAIAEALDYERKSGQVRGPLHGIPVLVKDNIATGDRMSTSAGSLALDGVRTAEDAPLVKRLRDAGTVLLGETTCRRRP